MSEIEDEAFMTNVEKKKANKLASYANLYKQQMANSLRKYGEFYRASKKDQNEAVTLKIQDVVSKYETNQKKLAQRFEAFKKKAEKQDQEDSQSDEEDSITKTAKKRYLDKRTRSDDGSVDKEDPEECFGDNVGFEEYLFSNPTLRYEKGSFVDDPYNFQASVKLFNDLESVSKKIDNLLNRTCRDRPGASRSDSFSESARSRKMQISESKQGRPVAAQPDSPQPLRFAAGWLAPKLKPLLLADAQLKALLKFAQGILVERYKGIFGQEWAEKKIEEVLSIRYY